MILIRADANEMIGTGHVMRCLSLARALAKCGEECLFVTADHKAEGLIRQYDFRFECLNSPWQDLERELPMLRVLIGKCRPALLLIDSYAVTKPYFETVHCLCRTAYMDDLDAGVWPVDFLINYNIFAKAFDYTGYRGTGTVLLTGLEYVPLREEFRSIPPREAGGLTDILVTAGGSDPMRISEQILEGICGKPEWSGYRFHFVIGTMNPRLERIWQIAGGLDNVLLHVNETRMSALMKQCGLAVAAAGSTLYELCACGTPAITYVLADNQRPAAEQFAAERIMLSAGDCREEGFFSRLEEQMKLLAGNPEFCAAMAHRMQTLVDGNGATRLAQALMRD